MNQSDLSGRLARWSLKLQAYNFSIEHRKGSVNVVADTLSRMQIEELHGTVGKKINLEDPEFQSTEYIHLREDIERRKAELPDLEVRGNIVFKRTEFRTGDQAIDLTTLWKVWIPTGLRQHIIMDAHQPSSAAHGGTDKTIHLIRPNYFWPGLSSDVRKFVSQCEICKETKSPNRKLRPPMGRAFTTERTF